MDKIEKFLKKLILRDKERILQVTVRILCNDLDNLDIKKLKGIKDVYRVRVGDFRIVFKIEIEYNTIIEIYRRDDRTYK